MVYENAFNFKDKEDDEEELNIKKEFKKMLLNWWNYLLINPFLRLKITLKNTLKKVLQFMKT